MAYDQEMVDRFRAALAGKGDIDERNMFGALGFMVNDKLTVCVGDKDVMYKFTPEDLDDLIERGVAQSAVMGKRTMKSWAHIPNARLEDENHFDNYLDKALAATDHPDV